MSDRPPAGHELLHGVRRRRAYAARPDPDGALLDSRIAGRSVRENLAAAVAAGRLVERPDGGLALPPGGSKSSYLQVKETRQMACVFLNDFLFRIAFDRAAVPAGCRNCFKIKIMPADLRGLVALRDVLEDAPYHAKCGVDLNNPFSRDFYAAYLFLDGLAEAQAAWPDVRARVDADPKLGSGVPMKIKRGCSNYEAWCGPSDQWTFEGVEDLERELRPRFQVSAKPPPDYQQRREAIMGRWIQMAYSLKDDSYLDFTGGRPLHAETLSYPA